MTLADETASMTESAAETGAVTTEMTTDTEETITETTEIITKIDTETTEYEESSETFSPEEESYYDSIYESIMANRTESTDISFPKFELPVTESTEEQSSVEMAALTTEAIVAWVKDKFEEISVIITLILTIFYQIRKHAVLNKSIGTLNNNAITVAENSKSAIGQSLAEVASVSAAVAEYKEEMTSLLAEIRANDAEKKKLEESLASVEKHLNTAKLANVELANEVAELLVLANIPNAKKNELYARHLAAVRKITDAENTEVNEDVEQTT